MAMGRDWRWIPQRSANNRLATAVRNDGDRAGGVMDSG